MIKLEKNKKALENKTRTNTYGLDAQSRIKAIRNGAPRHIDIYNLSYEELKVVTKEYEALGFDQWIKIY